MNSIFRKVSLSLWNSLGDPSVYGFVEADVTHIENHQQILPEIIYALSQTMLAHPELATMIRWGKIVPKDEKIISVMVYIPGKQKDLSILNIHVESKPDVEDIKNQIQIKAEKVRRRKDPHLGPLLKIAHSLPHFLLKPFLKFYSFVIYELGIKIPQPWIPHRPFGSIIVSNVGSLGIKKALLPLVPLSRASLMVSVGVATDEACVIDKSIQIRKICHLGVTFDHRLFDGAHAAEMLKVFEDSLARNIQKKVF